jgi:hypothetical protein
MSDPAPQQIELKLQSLQQMFNSMDPSPFHRRDLDHDAEEFIVSWMMEHPLHSPVALVVHVEQPPPEPDAGALLRDAIHNYFDYRATLNRNDVRRLLREGTVNFILATAFLIFCTFAGRAIEARFGTGGAITREGLTILGWVAMWRPLDIFLYRWWPLHRRGLFYRKLAAMPVEVRAAQVRA